MAHALALMLPCVRARAHFHAAIEFCAVLDSDARRFQIASNVTGIAKHYALAPAQVAFDLALHKNLGSFDVRADVTGLPDREPRFIQANAAIHFAVNYQVGFACEFAFDANAARENRGVGTCRLRSWRY